MLYAGPQVLTSGVVTACGCRDLEGASELVMGNIHDSSLEEITSGRKIRNLRDRFYKGKIPDICQDCRHYIATNKYLADI